MQCMVKIVRTEGGEKSEFCVSAQMEEEGESRIIKYNYDGAPYTLTLAPRAIYHQRGGDMPLSMRFLQGQTTICTLGIMGACGTLEIFTKTLRVEFLQNAITARCAYYYKQEQNKIVNLNVRISFL